MHIDTKEEMIHILCIIKSWMSDIGDELCYELVNTVRNIRSLCRNGVICSVHTAQPSTGSGRVSSLEGFRL